MSSDEEPILIGDSDDDEVVDTGGKGAWKPVITCWVHLEPMCIFPTM